MAGLPCGPVNIVYLIFKTSESLSDTLRAVKIMYRCLLGIYAVVLCSRSKNSFDLRAVISVQV